MAIMRELISLLRSVLLIPLIGNLFIFYQFLEIFFTIIVCDSESYFKSKFECWSRTHLIYVGFSFISFIFIMYLSHIFISFSFSKKDKMEQFISKSFIVNASIQFLYVRAITIILLEFLCIKDILMVVVFYMFLSSMYVVYCFHLENKYQRDNNVMSNVMYYLNLIYFWDSMCLFIGKLLSKTKFEGMLDIFFIGVGLVVILTMTFPKKRMNSPNIAIENEIDVYNQIRLMIDAIDERGNNREYLFDIFAYLSQKLQSQNLENNEIILKKKIESFKNESNINDKEFEYYLYEQVDLLFREYISFFRESMILKVTYALFQIEKLGRYNKGYINLVSVSEMEKLSFSQDFLVYRLKRRLEDKGIEDGVDKSNLSFRYQCNQLIAMISKVSTIYSYFWNLLLSSSDYEDISKLHDYGLEINEIMDLIDDKFKALQSSSYNNKRTVKLYGMYIRDILNDPERALIYLNNEQNDNEISFQKNLDLNSLNPSADFQFMIISGKEDNFGIISRISLGFCHLLGYSDIELIGQNLDYILPECVQKNHLEMLKNKTLVSRIGENNQKTLKSHFVLLKTSAKCLLPINLEVGIILDEDYNPIIFSKVNYDAEQYNFFSPGVYFLITNHKLIIESFTTNALDHLNLTNQIINGNSDITHFIKDFNEEVLTKLMNSKHTENLKVKLKILKQKYSKEKLIIWKNDKKYKMNVEEIIIQNCSNGFIFKIENSDSRDSVIFTSTQRLSIIGGIGGGNSGKRNSITALKEIEKRKDFPQIGKNFVPDNIDEVNFDINDKLFLFQDKTLEGKTIQPIGDYFNDRFFQPEINNDTNSIQNSDEEEEKESDDSDDFEESEEKEIKVKNFFVLNDVEEDNINYYKVKTHNIKLSIFNYSKNIAVEVTNFPKESKVEQVMKGEYEKNKQITNGNSKSITFQVGTNSNKNNNEKKVSPKEKGNDIIKKMVSPRFINKSVLIFIILYSIILVSVVFISILFFINLYSSRNNILKIHTVISYLTDIYIDILNTNFFAIEMMLLLNDKYTNLYQNKDEYFEECKYTILSLYESSIQEIEYFCYTNIEISNEAKDIIENFQVGVKNYQSDGKGLKYTFLEMKLTDALSEYDYALFDYGNTEKSSLNPQNVNLFFIVFNVDSLIEGIEYIFGVYYKEINQQISNEKKILIIYLIIFIILEILGGFLGAKASIILVVEKEKFLKYFYKIGDEDIRNTLIKCEQFIKLNREGPSNMIAEPEIHLENENESIDSEMSPFVEDDETKIIFKKKKKNPQKKQKMLENMQEIKFNIYATLLCYICELIFCSYVTIYVIKNLTKVPYFDVVEYLTVKYERLPINALNNLRLFLYFHPFIFEDTDLLSKIENIRYEIINIYYNISLTYNRLFGNITKHNFPQFIKDKYLYIEKSPLCDYISVFLTNYSLDCIFFSSNITNQGLALVYSYLMNNLYYLFNIIEDRISDSINKGNSYNELYYGTDNYNNIGPEEENPFLLFNDNVFKNFTVVIIYLVRPVIRDLIQSVTLGVNSLFSHLRKIIVIINVIAFGFLILFYIFYITPFVIQKNLQLNKTRKMLGIIPKDIFLEILNNEKMGKKEKKI